ARIAFSKLKEMKEIIEIVISKEAIDELEIEKSGVRLRIQRSSNHAQSQVNAEDPAMHKPSPGKITSWHAPGGPGVRIDTAAYAEYVIPPYYDSLIAKLIVHGSTRDEAIRRMDRALDMFVVEGVKTTVPLHRQILRSPEFLKGDIYTKLLEHLHDTGARPPEMA